MNYFISMFIDNELSIDEKMHFVEDIHASKEFKQETVSFLRQEKALCTLFSHKAPALDTAQLTNPRLPYRTIQPIGMAIAASILLLAAFYYLLVPQPLTGINGKPAAYQHRFVIYQAGASRVEIAGSFTNWRPMPLYPAGSSGYWEITLEVAPGEHTFSYILDGDKIMADPTVSMQEKDDFGTVNSILFVEAS